jgi:hypothetical protein
MILSTGQRNVAGVRIRTYVDAGSLRGSLLSHLSLAFVLSRSRLRSPFSIRAGRALGNYGWDV